MSGGFDPDKYLQKNAPMLSGQPPAFDPDAYLAKNSGKDIKGASQAGLEKFANTVLLGNLPQFQAGLGSAMGLGDYTQLRDENIKRMASQEQEHPTASKIGTGLGIGASLLVPGGAVAKEAGLLAKIGAGAKTGAVYGALSNPGDTEGEISPFQLKERSKNAAMGAALGAGTAGVIGGLQKGAEYISPILKGRAEKNAMGAIGVTKAAEKKLGEEGSRALGREALDSGLIDVLSTPSSIAKKTAALKEKAGEEIGSLITGADQAGASKIDSVKQAVGLLEDPEILASSKIPGAKGLYNSALNEAETLASNGELSLKQAHDLRRGVDKAINFNRKRMDLKPGEQEVLYKIRDSLNNAINDGVNSIEGNSTDALKAANKKFSSLSKIQDIAENRSAMNSANRSISLTDSNIGAGGLAGTIAAGGGPMVAGAVGTGAALANKFGRTFGDSIAARGFDAAAKAANKGAIMAGNLSPSQLAKISPILNKPSFQPEELADPETIKILSSNPDLIDAIQDPKIRESLRKQIMRRNPISK